MKTQAKPASETKNKTCGSCGLATLNMGNPDQHDYRCPLAALIFQAAVDSNGRGQAGVDERAVLDQWGEYETQQGRAPSQERAVWAAVKRTEAAIASALAEVL